MNRHRTAVVIVLSALALGIAGDVLLRWVPWGVNALLWTVLFCVAARVCAGSEGRRAALFPMLCALLAAGGILWRESNVLVALDVLLLLACLPMIALASRGVRIQAAGLAELGAAIAVTGAQSVAGFPQLILRDLSWKRMPRFGSRGAGVALRGVLIAAPALLIFGLLLTSADERFAGMFRELIVFDIREQALHVIMTGIIAAICAGYLRSLALSGAMPRLGRPEILRLPAAETNVALALVNVLFALFVIVQFRYFFGAAPAQLAQYARRGFFELVWVVALVVPMLLLLEWLVGKGRGFRLFRVMALVQVALVFVIAASALRRMQLYRDAFGLTRLRFFTTAFMIWLAALLIWFVCTVLTGRRHRFALGALATGMAIVVALHVINPDRIIVETNVERARAGQRAFDATYALSLSDDAMPAIVEHADIAGPQVLKSFANRPRPAGWRTWNVSRALARRLATTYESNATPPIARP
jgi:hypothetical protein